jgi:cytochrome c-type biogenesis protein CcmH/NrfF
MIACFTHWYTSALYVVPVGLLGGGGWVLDRKQKRAKRRAAQAVAKPAKLDHVSERRLRRARHHALGGARRPGAR